MHGVDAYAEAVVAGTVPAGKYHRLACARHLRDRAHEGTPAFPYWFDLERVDRFVRFASKLKHYKGEWAGQSIILQPSQVFRLGSIFGWVHVVTGLRRIRTSYNEIPRKNGKSLEASIVALYVTFFDGEPGAEGYCYATKRDQSKIVFGDAKKLVQSSGLKDRLKVLTANLNHEASASKFEPLGADHDSTDGLNPNLIIADELHAMKDRRLMDVMETATGARRQPLHFQITTAGNDPVSPCGDQHDYACKILDGVLEDETFFAFIAHADPDDDWTSLETARKANPNYGVSVKPDDLQAKITKAISIPAAAAGYQQKHLNLWVNVDAPWLSMDGWRKGQSSWSVDDLEHESCWVGVDLSNKLDLSALVFVFPPVVGRPRWRILPYVWTPADTLIERARRDRAPYDVWVRQGYLLTTPGETIDHGVIRDVLKANRERFDIEEIGFDPWHAHDTIGELKAVDGFSEESVIEVPQTAKFTSGAVIRLGAEIATGNVDGNGSPLLGWCASNVVVEYDRNNNPVLSKKKSRGRIDPWSAAVNAISLYLRTEHGPELTAENVAMWL